MRLRLFDRIRRLVHPRRVQATGTIPQGRHRRDRRQGPGYGPSAGPGEPSVPAQSSGPVTRTAGPAPDEWPAPGASSVPGAQHVPAGRASGSHGVRVGGAKARIREAPAEAAAGLPPDRYEVASAADLPSADLSAAPDTRTEALARAAAGIPQQAGRAGPPSRWGAREALRLLPFAEPNPRDWPRTADGRRDCGSLEAILWRQWDAARPPPPEVVEAVDRLAELPERIKERLAAELEAIFIGPGGVPDLDEMTALRGVRLPSGQASWDACAGAYGDRKIVVGSRPSPTPDVMCHEVGHALDDLDSPPGKWQSDSAEFRMLYDQCQPHLASDFHRQPGGLGRKEFFADAFAAIASGQRPALVDMLSGDTRTALRVMLYFNRRYAI
jgi:hypothetical protein